MDTKLIRHFGEDILSYRLRTARNKKRMQYEDFHKQLMKLHKEEKALYEQKRNLGWESLIPPVQRGWKRCFVLRQDVLTSKYADFFENILKKINTYDWSHRKDFMVKKRKRGRKIYIVKGQKLLQPEEHHFQKLKFSEAEKQLFHAEYHFEKWNKGPVKKYVFNEPCIFVLQVRPNMIDKIRKRDVVIEARLKAINNYLEKDFLRVKLNKLLYGNNRWHWKEGEKEKEKSPLKNKSVERIIDELKIDW
jgi:hypothetical protein